MGERIRTFIAIVLPGSVIHAIGKVQESIGKSGLPIRCVRKEGIHLTLKFLGDIDKDDVEKVKAAMERSAEGFAPFTLAGEGVGIFPDFKRPRVIWAGVSGALRSLFALQGNLETQLESLGFPKDNRSFKGHLTLGRVKARVDRDEFMKVMEGLKGFETASFKVESIVLFQSRLRPSGAIYTSLAEVPLKSA